MLIYLQTIETEEDKSKFEDIYREYRGLMYYVAPISVCTMNRMRRTQYITLL